MTNANENKVVDYLDGFQIEERDSRTPKKRRSHKTNNSEQYAGNVLQFFPTAEGYVKATKVQSNYSFDYVFNYTDHLGNIRLSYTKNPQTGVLEILDETHYYPFGLKHEVYIPALKQNFVNLTSNQIALTNVTETDYQYKYNGFEYQDELGLGWYDYMARNYDPALGRWMNIDPAAEMSRKFSPYAYALDNPVFFIDPDGMMAEAFDLDDDYKLNQDGSIELIQRTDAATDTLYASDGNGDVDYNNSITVSKGVLDNTETIQIADDVNDPNNEIPTRIMDVSKTDNKRELFEFMADNTYVEHSITFFRNGKTFIGTSFRENVELSLTVTIPRNGQFLLSDHSHSFSNDPSPADNTLAEQMRKLFPFGTPILRIYSSGTYQSYDENTPNVSLNGIVITGNKNN